MSIAKVPARRTLAQEIDKLDGILEGLDATVRFVVADALQQAVERTLTTTVSQAAQQAVQLVLAHPDLQARLCGTLSPKPVASIPIPVSATSADGTLASAWERCGRVLHQGTEVLSEAAGVCWRLTRRHPGIALAGCGTAVVALIAAWWCGPLVAAVAGWVGGLVTACAARLGAAPGEQMSTRSNTEADGSPDRGA